MLFERAALFIILLAAAGASSAADAPVIGLITKTETNPFFVAMRDGARPRPRPGARSS